MYTKISIKITALKYSKYTEEKISKKNNRQPIKYIKNDKAKIA